MCVPNCDAAQKAQLRGTVIVAEAYLEEAAVGAKEASSQQTSFAASSRAAWPEAGERDVLSPCMWGGAVNGKQDADQLQPHDLGSRLDLWDHVEEGQPTA